MMEKPPVKSKGNKILKYLPKATSFSIPSQPYSPGRDRPHHHQHYRGFSGPMIPAEARQRTPAGGGGAATGGCFDEPTSPKVSCIGQIKHKKKLAAVCSRSRSRRSSPVKKESKKSFVSIGKMFRRKTRPGGGRRSDSAAGVVAEVAGKPQPSVRPAAPAPALSQMRKFASGRESSLSNFDWRATQRVADEPVDHDSDYFMDDGSDGDEEEEFMIPHSAPMVVGGGKMALEPKKEVNLWKRRTMVPPRPLQLDS